MYNHIDQSWRKMPAFLSEENEDLLAFRIVEYAKKVSLPRLLVIYHGGEPLLAGIETLRRITTKIKEAVTSTTSVDFSLQTNGTLLTEEILDALEALNISVSLSLDGPAAIHDKHRVNHAGKATFLQVQQGLYMLLNRPKIFSGIIAVIDPFFPPGQLLKYFNSFSIPSLDFLLPDANFNRLPPGRKENPNLYSDWLIECFDLWFDQYSHLRIRFFDSILDALVGLPSKTDAFGFGDVSLLNIETDGSYHDLDVLKIAYEGASNLHLGGLSTTSIEIALHSSQIQKHRRLLSKEGLNEICQKCSVVDICAGGAVPHRYSNDGFNNPSIYSKELFTLINHAQKKLTEQLESEIEEVKNAKAISLQIEDLNRFEDSDHSYNLLKDMLDSWGDSQKDKFKQALLVSKEEQPEYAEIVAKLLSLSNNQLKYLSIQPSVYAWTTVISTAKDGGQVTSIDGKLITADYSYVQFLSSFLHTEFAVQRINRDDNWLRVPFGDKIQYETEETILEASTILDEAYALIAAWNKNVLKEIKLIAPEIQFIKDVSAHPEKIVSFSDNSVPGALFVTIRLGEQLIEPCDLADSILHEYRHQKLYLLQRISDVIVIDVPLVSSPWREELRPPSGLFHAIYVFSFLRKFWEHLSISGNEDIKERAMEEVYIITDKLQRGMDTLRKTKLTETGNNLLRILHSELIAEPA